MGRASQSQRRRARAKGEAAAGEEGEHDRAEGGVAEKEQKAMKPGDWICPECNYLVFGRNDTCRLCGVPKPPSASADEEPEAAARRRKGTGKSARRQHAGDGDCSATAGRPYPSALRLVLGRWDDCKGACHEVTLDESGRTCSVATTASSGGGARRKGRTRDRLQERRAFIHVDEEGWVCWGRQASYYLDVESASDAQVRWKPTVTSKSYVWRRAEQPRSEAQSGRAPSTKSPADSAQEQESASAKSPEDDAATDDSPLPATSPSPSPASSSRSPLPATSPSPSPASSSTGSPTEEPNSRSSPGGSSHGKLLPHFCIFQGDGYGISGWTRENGGRKNRWDTILLSLLQCVMMDGEWPREIKASAFVGADAIHMSGAVQRLAMPFLGYHDSGAKRYGPATCCDWEGMLWDQCGVDSKGLRWELSEEPPATRHAAQEMLLRRLEETLEAAPRDAVAIVLDYANPDATYEELKMLGVNARGDDSAPRTVFLVLGGAHGFDGRNDADGELLRAILGRFRKRLGPERVLAVDLCEPRGPARPVRLTTSKVAAFLSCEYVRGTLAHVVAGVGVRIKAAAKAGAN